MADFQISKAGNTQDLTSARSSQAVQSLKGAQAKGTNPKKIDAAARNFESLLVGHWLEQAEKSFASVPGSDPDEQNDSSRQQFMSIACESLAKGMSKTSSLGISKMISKSLTAAAHPDQTKGPEATDGTLLPRDYHGNSSSIK